MSDMPALIGRYVVERELGSGGMGEVYLAYSPAGDPVAVKLIRSDRLDPVTRARFEKEALIVPLEKSSLLVRRLVCTR